MYVGGEVHWVENLDPDKTSWLELNTFVWRLGYRKSPVHYWFKHPTMPIYLPITDDQQAMKMMTLLPCSRMIEVFCIGGGARQIQLCEEEDKDPNYEECIPHNKFKTEMVMMPLSACQVGQSMDQMNHVIDHEPSSTITCKGKKKVVVVEEFMPSDVNIIHQSNDYMDFGPNRYDGGVEEERMKELERSMFGDPNKDGEGDDDDEFLDSDYETHPEDEGVDGEVDDDVEFDKFVDNQNVFEEYADIGFAGEISDHSYDSDELREKEDTSDTDGDDADREATSNIKQRMKKKNIMKGKTWVPERDLKNPNFEVGQIFADSKQFKDVVKKYAVKHGVNLYFQKNTNVKVEVICGKKKGKKDKRTRPFWMYAGDIEDGAPELVIKTLNLQHKNCEVVPRVQMCTSTFLAKEYVDIFRTDPYISRKLFMNLVKKDFGQTISHKQVIRARALAALMNSGSEDQQYNLLESYAEVLKKTNPGSTVKMMTEMVGEVRKFKRFYVCFDACKKGWKAGCRPLIGLDDCHIKTKYPGVLLSVVGIDANNGMFPIAYAVIEIENRET
ncbi:hypothetical protein M0R45_019583 [Rubus argutus]|uniref:PB1-like domain-containing protein n=1 Tax=Rubus argutus TaxID=59490 RepID=A0AAW1X9B6_RUBAR